MTDELVCRWCGQSEPAPQHIRRDVLGRAQFYHLGCLEELREGKEPPEPPPTGGPQMVPWKFDT